MQPWGSKAGRDDPGPFHLRHCPRCHYSCVANPRTDYDAIYSAAYYQGQGIDPLVDYVFELEHPRETIRQYEWRGVLRAVRSLVEVTPRTRWLDYGCGNGGLLRYCREATGCDVAGHDEGWIRDRAAHAGIPILDAEELDARAGTYDVVTAIEVLEHLVDPLEGLQSIRRLLRPGGLFFYTTGNAEPFRDRLTSWDYVSP
jgi:2-polyprenyl-3-methyl-5-hydroxy-6-metoxy-1,4-benzoquinol methylase